MTSEAGALAERTRYRGVLPDWEAFERATDEPPPCVLAHPARLARDTLAGLLRDEEVAAEPVAWHPYALRLPPGCRPGLLWPFRVGLYQIQEEASLLPVTLLDPQPGERVLDLCAAPGGKTAQISVAMRGTGTVVANDRSGRRLVALREKAKRWALLNVSTSVWNGCAYPLESGPFDRVLVDAPCSAERDAANPAARARGTARFRLRIAQTQRDLLRRALALCRPGGRVVYSTCSLAPEENEAVVDAVLRALPGAARVLPLCVEGLGSAPGLTDWRDAHFDTGLWHALRLWPHRSGTGGFFAAALEPALQPDGAPGSGGPTARLEDADDALLGKVKLLVERFGLPEAAVADLRFVRRGRRELHAVSRNLAPPAYPPPGFAGIPFAKLSAWLPKPTTAAALLVGRLATRNTLEVDPEQAAAYLSRRSFAPRSDQLSRCDASGFVILRRRGLPLGAGLLRSTDAGLVVESAFPRAWVPETERRGEKGDA